MKHRYLLHGVGVASELALDDLQPDRSRQEPRVQIRICNLPTALEGNVTHHGYWQCAGQQLLLSIPEVARFLITAAEICVEPAADADPETLRALLLGSAWAACCHQRDMLILHASAVVSGNAAIVLMGNSGAGKSTLAALLAARGQRIAADDTCVLVSERGQTHLYPGPARVKLWRDALPILASAAAHIGAAPRQPGKFQLSLAHHWWHRPVRVQGVLMLDTDRDGSTPRFEALSALDCMRAMAGHTFRPNVLRLLHRERENFAACSAVAASTPVYRWVRPWGRHRQDAMLEMLDDWVQQHGSSEQPRPPLNTATSGIPTSPSCNERAEPW